MANMKCRHKASIQYWMPPIILELLIFILSSRSSLQLGPQIIHIDKFYHTLIYFIFTLLLWRAFYYASPLFFKKRAIWFALILAIFFGLSDEWHQSFVVLRDASIFDFFFDIIGVCIATLLVVCWNNGKKAKAREYKKEYTI